MYVHVKTGCSCSKHLHVHVHAILATAHIETYSRFKDLVMDFLKFIPGHTLICTSIIILTQMLLA